jgi:hypothetical protein
MERLAFGLCLLALTSCSRNHARMASADGGSDLAAPSCPTSCNADSRQTIDCHGQVVASCKDNEQCAQGACVAACDVAVANKSSVGCEYYAIDPDTDVTCFAAYIVNTWSTPVTISVDFDGTALDVAQIGRIPTGTGKSITYAPLPNRQLPPGKVAILFLAGVQQWCPVYAFNQSNVISEQTGFRPTFHIKTSAPVVAYDVDPFLGGGSAVTSGTLLLPTSVWDTSYVAVAPWSYDPMARNPTSAIVAMEDDTHVTIKPVVAIQGGAGIAGSPAKTPVTYTLSRGQALQFNQPQELTGSAIRASKPVGVWGMAPLFRVESTCCSDTAHQQLPPISSMGNEYVGVRYRDRVDGMVESPPWRMVGVVDGTTLTYEPTTPSGAPTTLAQGQVVSFDAAGPFLVRSQDGAHPFYMSAHMTGGSGFDGRGDAEFVNVIPTGQYRPSYVFFSDPSYPETNLVVVRAAAPNGTFQDVSLDCMGALSGWQPVDSAGRFQYTRVDLSRYNFQGQNGCDNGRHEITSGGSFTLTVWGWGSGDTDASGYYSRFCSYAYPAGSGVASINSVQQLPPVQ